MDNELMDELNYTTDILTKTGFYSNGEILEVLEDEFMGEDIDFDMIEISSPDFDNSNFSILEDAFKDLANNDIVAIHNCGYDIEEGVNDAFELFIHLKNNSLNPEGFCFYSFEDIEEAINEKSLKITFGDFEDSEEKALEIGNKVFDTLKNHGLNVKWDGTLNNQIEINQFDWDKKYDSSKDYEMEGAFETFIESH